MEIATYILLSVAVIAFVMIGVAAPGVIRQRREDLAWKRVEFAWRRTIASINQLAEGFRKLGMEMDEAAEKIKAAFSL